MEQAELGSRPTESSGIANTWSSAAFLHCKKRNKVYMLIFQVSGGPADLGCL